MPAVIVERWDSRGGQADATGQGSGASLTWVVIGTYDEVEVRSLIEAELPAYYRHWPFQSYTLDYKGGDVWHVESQYGHGQAGEQEITFNTTGGTQHVSQSLSTTAYQPPGGGAAPPSFKNAIGVNGESVEGVDKTVPVFSFSVTAQVPYAALLGTALIGNLHDLTGAVNQAAFRGFERGEVLFLGAQCTFRTPLVPVSDPNLTVPVTYQFSSSKNQTGLTIGDIENVSKKGWEYLWIRYKDSTDANTLVKIPAFVYVEQVYRYGDFTKLGLG